MRIFWLNRNLLKIEHCLKLRNKFLNNTKIRSLTKRNEFSYLLFLRTHKKILSKNEWLNFMWNNLVESIILSCLFYLELSFVFPFLNAFYFNKFKFSFIIPLITPKLFIEFFSCVLRFEILRLLYFNFKLVKFKKQTSKLKFKLSVS